MRYDDAFDATLRARHQLLTREELEAAGRRRQGRLMAGDNESYAMVDAFKLHRAHTDAFRLAIDDSGSSGAAGRSTCIVDLGSGPGNVGAAFIEAWSGNSPSHVSYIGIESHSLMRRLGFDFLRAFAPEWFRFTFVESVAGIVVPPADRCFVTFNYVLQQPGVSGQDVKDWAGLIAALCARGNTIVLAVSPHSISPSLKDLDRSEDLRREMSVAGLAFRLHTTTHRMDRRMPREDGRGWVLQPARGDGWPNIRIERYEFLSRAGAAEADPEDPGPALLR